MFPARCSSTVKSQMKLFWVKEQKNQRAKFNYLNYHLELCVLWGVEQGGILACGLFALGDRMGKRASTLTPEELSGGQRYLAPSIRSERTQPGRPTRPNQELGLAEDGHILLHTTFIHCLNTALTTSQIHISYPFSAAGILIFVLLTFMLPLRAHHSVHLA